MDVAENLGADRTVVSSRAAILGELDQFIARREPVLVFVAKLDRLKSFNHAHGVDKGDQLIAAVGQRMVDLAGDAALVGALRSDIFMMVVRPNSATTSAQIEQVSTQVTQPISINNVEYIPELKIGVAVAEPGRSAVDKLLIEASAAMRAAVASRETVVTADDRIRTAAHIETVVERDIEAAIRSDTLSFGYQPLVTLHDGVVHGAEALLRWDHPELGSVDPAIVMGRVDAMGLTDMFTEWSISRVASEWTHVVSPDTGLEGMSVSVNLSESQLANPLCVPWMQRALQANGLRSKSVILEVVESGPVGIGEAAAKTLRTFADDGYLIVLDDFGTGFNALEYFLKFPVHGLKFDQSLIASMVTNETARTIVKGVARIADELDVVTVGEGLESVAEAELCREIPLTLGQGWHFGLPVAAEEFAAAARRSRENVDPVALERSRLSQRSPASSGQADG